VVGKTTGRHTAFKMDRECYHLVLVGKPAEPGLVPQVIGSIIALVGLIAVGVGVGVGISKSHKPSSSSSGNATPVNETNPNVPSSFVKNPALKKSFYGIAYTPEGAQLPSCGANLCECIF
jgi:hypothetical protein